MADLEKTMEAMQEWIDAAFPDEYPLGIMQDALELLKEQQKEIEERTNEAAAYAELLIKYGYEFT